MGGERGFGCQIYGCHSKAAYSIELNLCDFSILSTIHCVRDFQLSNLTRVVAIGLIFGVDSRG